MCFPDEFAQGGSWNYFEQLKDKAILQIKYIKTGDATLIAQINAITDYQLSLLAPAVFDPADPQNSIVKMELSFESLCTQLEELGVQNPKRLTVFEFYSKIRYFKAKNKPK